MVEESNIFGVMPENCSDMRGFYNFKLLKTTDNAALYLAFKAGKRFLIKTTKDNTEQQIRMLRREYELSIGCDHPHLVHIYTVEEELPFGLGLVMEYIEGRTLDEYLAEKPSKKERNRIFSELLSAVGYLHKRGIIHNDLKPENILVSRIDNSLKIIDFGLADSDTEYALRTLGCTPRYASPELRAQSGNLDARSDIYSIGVLMQSIFGSSSISARCTNERVSKRYANIEALQRAWRNRYRPYYYIVAVLLLSALLFPALFAVRTQVERDRNKDLQAQIISRMERDIATIYEATKDSVSQSCYIEFTSRHVIAMEQQCQAYVDSLNAAINNAEMEVVVATRYGAIMKKYYYGIGDLLNEMPTYAIDAPKEHLKFYDSLCKNKLPYRPYGSK